jgi:hypothetical protein
MRILSSTLLVMAICTVASATLARTTSSARSTAAQDSAAGDNEASDSAIVVNGYHDIVVNGRAIHCRPLAGDPLDKVRVGGGPDYMMIVPNGRGGFVGKRITEQITGPEFWQRVGVGMGAYTFRAPSGGKPMCIGGRGQVGMFGGFRRIVDATPYRGRRLRFTAWVATGRAGQVSFWLAAGSDRFRNGGNTNNVPFRGNHGWTPVLLETGPIHLDADHISYGFNLQGSGDV